MRSNLVIATAMLGALGSAANAAEITRYKMPAGPNGKPQRILESVEVPAGANTLYVSGQIASPIDPKTPMAQATMADFGDTKTQTLSVLGKIKAILASHGYAMSDIVKATLFVAPDPKLGKMDFDGVNAGFDQYFNTADNPNTVARSTFQVGALAGPNFLIEIEVVAAKMK